MWRMAASGGLDMDGTKGVRQCVVDIGFQHSKGPSSIHESGFTRTYLAGPPIQAILPVSLARHFLLGLFTLLHTNPVSGLARSDVLTRLILSWMHPSHQWWDMCTRQERLLTIFEYGTIKHMRVAYRNLSVKTFFCVV